MQSVKIKWKIVIELKNTANENMIPTLYMEKYFLNLDTLKQIWIVITLFRLIWNQMEFRLVQNKSVNGKYNLITVDLTRFRKKSVCLYVL